MSCRNKCCQQAQRLSAVRKSVSTLTQVTGHQIGIVEILHAQSDNVDELLYHLHELHCSGIDLEVKKDKEEISQFQLSLPPQRWKCGAQRENSKRQHVGDELQV